MDTVYANERAAAQRVEGLTEFVADEPDYSFEEMRVHEEDGVVEFSIGDELIAGAYRQELVE